MVEPALLTLAPEGGYAHVGPVGAGHFVKMVHNGIEYGLMQAYAEGFEIMGKADEFDLDLHEIASIWRYGSVVRSWLLDLAERALRPGAGFDEIKGVVVDSGEGRWTAQEAIDRGVPAPVIATSLFTRFASQEPDSFQLKMLVGAAQPVRRPRRHAGVGPAGPGDRDPDPVVALTPVDDVPAPSADAVRRGLRGAPGPALRAGALGRPDGAGVLRDAWPTDADGHRLEPGRRLRGRRARRPARRRRRQPAPHPRGPARPGRRPVGSFSPMPTVGPVDECVAAYQRTMSRPGDRARAST